MAVKTAVGFTWNRGASASYGEVGLGGMCGVCVAFFDVLGVVQHHLECIFRRENTAQKVGGRDFEHLFCKGADEGAACCEERGLDGLEYWARDSV